MGPCLRFPPAMHRMLGDESGVPNEPRRELRSRMAHPMRRIAGFAAALALALLSVEASAHLLIWLSGPFLAEEIRSTGDIYAEQSERIRTMLDEDGSGRSLFDARLGWRYRPGYRDAEDAINRQGLRSLHDYAPIAPPGTLRIAAFGDSFVYGHEVALADSWPALMEASDGDLEVLNYGVGGYGTDQALLRYRAEGARLRPDLVLIGFSPICLRRNVNVYLRFLHNRNAVATKPRFVVRSDGELGYLENPVARLSEWRGFLEEPDRVRRFGVHDHWYRRSIYENALYDRLASARLLTMLWVRLDDRYFRRDRLERDGVFNDESDAFAVTVAILRTFAREVERDGSEASVLILPDERSLTRERGGRSPDFDPLVEELRREKVAVLDATLAFRGDEETPIDSWFMEGGHYSPAGNRRVASWLARELHARETAAKSRARRPEDPRAPGRSSGRRSVRPPARSRLGGSAA